MYAHRYIAQSIGTMEYPTDAPQAVPAITHISHVYGTDSF